jgi:predicted ABC-class ATPase
VQLGKILLDLRDRVIHGSQLGKRKLDLAFARRELDRKLLELGERYRNLAREGRVAVPDELEGLVAKVRVLEERMAREEQEVTRLQREQPSET